MRNTIFWSKTSETCKFISKHEVEWSCKDGGWSYESCACNAVNLETQYICCDIRVYVTVNDGGEMVLGSEWCCHGAVCDQFRYCYWVIVHNRSTHWRQYCVRIAFYSMFTDCLDESTLNGLFSFSRTFFLSSFFFFNRLNCYSLETTTNINNNLKAKKSQNE